MAIYIREAVLPESCFKCDLGNSEQVSDVLSGRLPCPFFGRDSVHQDCYTSMRHPDCPLTFIPDDHGRLIDAKALETSAYALAKAIHCDNIHIDAITDSLLGHAPDVIKQGPQFHD